MCQQGRAPFLPNSWFDKDSLAKKKKLLKKISWTSEGAYKAEL
jgi:hypothetical protein